MSPYLRVACLRAILPISPVNAAAVLTRRRREFRSGENLPPLNRLIFPHFVASLCDASATYPREFSTFRHESQATSKLLRRNSWKKMIHLTAASVYSA